MLLQLVDAVVQVEGDVAPLSCLPVPVHLAGDPRDLDEFSEVLLEAGVTNEEICTILMENPKAMFCLAEPRNGAKEQT